MTKRDSAELRKRFTKDCSIDRISGCYVNSEKEKVNVFAEGFQGLPEEEFYKFLDIAKKVVSGKTGNNLLTLSIPSAQEKKDGMQAFLMQLKSSRLKDDDLLDSFYNRIIDNYESVGNYLILLFHDVYDIIAKSKDNSGLDESEETYEYVLAAICPVEQSKPALGYRNDENRIGARIRDWVVKAPETGFVFPDYNERSSDIHQISYYSKDPVDNHPEFIEAVLNCEPVRTAAQEFEMFTDIIKSTCDDDVENKFIEIQVRLKEMTEEHNASYGSSESSPLTTTDLKDIMEDAGFDSKCIKSAEAMFKDMQDGGEVDISHLYSEKEIKAAEPARREKELLKQIAELTDKSGKTSSFRLIGTDITDFETVEKNGKTYYLIPDEKISKN